MTPAAALPIAIEPKHWNVVFHPEAATWWMNRAPVGRFKHVSAFAYLHGIKGWVMYDVQLATTRIVVLPDTEEALDIIEQTVRGCTVVSYHRKPDARLLWRAGFWCVPAIKHLLGVRSSALRPAALLADLLRDGGTIIHDAAESRDAGRSAAAGRHGSREPAEDCDAAGQAARG